MSGRQSLFCFFEWVTVEVLYEVTTLSMDLLYHLRVMSNFKNN